MSWKTARGLRQRYCREFVVLVAVGPSICFDTCDQLLELSPFYGVLATRDHFESTTFVSVLKNIGKKLF